ncbi:hypothetical protein ACP4OV_031461 [Aristida adscensionis]
MAGGFKVTRISEGAVKPAAATPEETLPLAWVDRHPTHRGLVESMHIFRSGADAAPAVIRGALARALVFFYPLAGRIVEGAEAGAPAIRCTADGVYFAEAAAGCSLEEVRFLERPLLLRKEDLVPYPGGDRWGVEPHNTIVMMQVTKFTCGGFVVGLRFNHAAADGMGAAQFLTAVGDLARGLPEPRVKPVWDREKFPNPKIKPGPLPSLPVLALDYTVLDFPASYIHGLKRQYEEHAGGKFCSGFDVLTAKLWQCRTRALNLAPGAEAKLCFFAGVRHLLKLDRGYYGNAIFPVKVSAPAAAVAGSAIVEVVDMIREAKKRMAAEFSRFAGEETQQDPFRMSFGYESVFVSDRSKLGFTEVDYGFGPPVFAGPLVNIDLIASVAILRAPLPLDGTRMLASCVTNEHSQEFVRGMKEDLP